MKEIIKKIIDWLKEFWAKQMENKKKFMYRVISCVLVLVMLGSGGYLLASFLTDRRSGKEFDELSNMVNTIPEDDKNNSGNGNNSNGKEDGDEAVTEKYEIINVNGVDVEVPLKYIDWDVMHEKNKDIYAWICVPGTKIDYPVLQHPTDDEYYLHKTLEGEFSWDGNIFSQATYNGTDFEDYHTVLYGHNRRSNYKMFKTLHFYEDSYFFKIYPHVFVYTEKGVYIYKIFAAYEFTSAHLLANYATNTQSNLMKYYEMAVGAAKDAGGNTRDLAEGQYYKKMITLSTCVDAYDEDDKRYLVQAMLIYDPTQDTQE